MKAYLPIPVFGKHVLIVEDEFPIAQSLSRDLAAMGGVIVGFAPNNAQARSILGTKVRVDLAIVDWELGNETSVAIVQSLSDRGTTVVLTTGHASKRLPGEFQNLACLTKPYDVTSSFAK